VLSPIDRYSEIFFGLIVALGFTCTLSVARAGDAGTRTMLFAAPTPGRSEQIDDIATAMYIHHMIRTQLYLDERAHERLRVLADRQGRTISDLVREAIARTYGLEQVDERISTLEGIRALWRDRADLGATDAYVRRSRRDTRRTRNQA